MSSKLAIPPPAAANCDPAILGDSLDNGFTYSGSCSSFLFKEAKYSASLLKPSFAQ